MPSTGPSAAPAGAVWTITSGETGRPISGAALTIAGSALVTDGAGRVVLAQTMRAGSLVDIVAKGYLDRQTLVRSSSEQQFSLWPRTSPTGLDEDLTQRLAYWRQAPSGLTRLGDSATRVVLVASSALRADAGVIGALQTAAPRMSAAAGGRIVFEVGAAGAGAVQVDLAIDPTLGSGATTRRPTRGFEIIGADIAFGRLVDARRLDVVLHELGHVFGLHHSVSQDDLMYPVALGRNDFSAREKLLMNLMLQRRPGNQFPDNDRSVNAASAGSGTSVIYCPLE